MPAGTQTLLCMYLASQGDRVLTYSQIAEDLGISSVTIWRNLSPLINAGRVCRDRAPLPDRPGWAYRYQVIND